MAEITSMKRANIRRQLEEVEVVIHQKLDFDTYNVTTSDTVTIADLPVQSGAYLIPTFFSTNVVTADGETATADFGLKPTSGSAFSADADGLDAAVNLNSVAITQGAIGTDAQMGARIDISGGATLYMTPNHNLEDAVAYVTFKYVVVHA